MLGTIGIIGILVGLAIMADAAAKQHEEEFRRELTRIGIQARKDLWK